MIILNRTIWQFLYTTTSYSNAFQDNCNCITLLITDMILIHMDFFIELYLCFISLGNKSQSQIVIYEIKSEKIFLSISLILLFCFFVNLTHLWIRIWLLFTDNKFVLYFIGLKRVLHKNQFLLYFLFCFNLICIVVLCITLHFANKYIYCIPT